MPQTLQLTNPMDMHLHLREGELLESVLPFTTQAFSAAVVMPNLKTPITTTTQALAYKKQILSLCSSPFEPLMSIFLTPELDKQELILAKEAGIKILKLYPKGATTGSEGGVKDILCEKTLQVFAIAEELGFILSIHGESNGFCMEREYEFLPVFAYIAQHFPHLRIIIEHMSDRRSLEMIEKYENLYATLTLHHITMNLDDVCGGMLNPHHFCKPMLKTRKDQQALLQAALKAHPKVSFGSDSAPHLASAKLSSKGAAGIFSAPILLPALTEVFESHNTLDSLQAFVSDRAITNYGLEHFPTKSITLERVQNSVPAYIDTPLGHIIPLRAQSNLSWRIKKN
ncbi:dihydroorotase [Helicobacter sp. MIT 21-1697]|uniref:dihydroorotase n=1 Tax=Helicobacter sp. MIT 21-1697 TaxID=2993733 RepID=UPI00224AB826|nr:dihydroorotase [Helicobacter sp. MIT 21-1697]MCX2716249.1 dihydroorotase [Helicobacter sp. MIT 21-1697]